MSAFDSAAIRAEFPGLKTDKGQDWHYLDTAATAQKPQAVVDAVARAMGEDLEPAMLHSAVAEHMGVRVGGVFAFVFALGAALAALAGALMAPISAVQIGMGEAILIPALVVIVIGGIGSVRGAFVAALLVGMVDTAGRAFLPPALRAVLPPSVAADLGPALAGIAMYVLMAAVLTLKPAGLFPARG